MELDVTIPRIIDTVEIKKKIMKMTPDERKRLGIGKGTLWYMKKNISDGKNIKIYDKVLSKLDSK
ncbi:hypothetical protein [Candidatus Nitrosotalea bavarica]|uniref:hypothetical protein n=1 Tax=Candidatus Nitrosotalea bavarica TaxID=1903277 RepID=UPI000C6FE5E5|nr:hypothetical protein [Candidatus Nitrosotalea bavarica]